MKKFNLYDKIKELQEIDVRIKELELEREVIIMSNHYKIFSNEIERSNDLTENDILLSKAHSIRRELLQQISIISNYEAKKINSELISN